MLKCQRKTNEKPLKNPGEKKKLKAMPGNRQLYKNLAHVEPQFGGGVLGLDHGLGRSLFLSGGVHVGRRASPLQQHSPTLKRKGEEKNKMSRLTGGRGGGGGVWFFSPHRLRFVESEIFRAKRLICYNSWTKGCVSQ